MEPRKRVWFGALLIVLIVSGGLTLIEMAARRQERTLEAKIQRKLAALKSAGQPVSAAELARLYPDPSPVQDASLILGKSLALTVGGPSRSKAPFIGGALPSRGVPMSAEIRAEVDAFVEPNKPAIQALPDRIPDHMWFPLGFTNGFTNLARLPFGEMRRLGQVLCLNAIARAEADDPAGAARSLEQDFQVSRAFRSDLLISHTMRRALEGMACSALEISVNRTRFSDQQLLALANVLTNVPPEELKAAVLVERSRGIWCLETFRSALQQRTSWRRSSLLGLWERLLARRIYSSADYLRYLDQMDDCLRAIELPIPARLRRMAELSQRPPEKGTIVGLLPDARQWEKAARRDAEVQAQLLVAHTGLEVERHRLAHGDRLPMRLTELVPDYLSALPLDPFDGKPLRYRLRTQGFVIYSVGADGSDDNGLEKAADKTDQTLYDITFTVER